MTSHYSTIKTYGAEAPTIKARRACTIYESVEQSGTTVIDMQMQVDEGLLCVQYSTYSPLLI